MTPRDVEEALWYRLRDQGQDSYWESLSGWWQHLIDSKGQISAGTDDVFDEWVLVLTEVMNESN